MDAPSFTLTLGAWLHDLSPFLLRWSASGGVRWYGLSYAMGFVIAWVILKYFSRSGRTPLSHVFLGDVLMAMVAGVIVGGRLGYVLIYDPSIAMDVSGSFPFWGVLRLTDGGMAFHGALVGVVVASVLLARRMRRDCPALANESFGTRWRHLTDLLAVACTAGLGLGRVANFINGELLGKIIAQPGQPAPAWSVRFPQELFEQRDMEYSAEQSATLQRLISQYGDDEHAISRMLEVVQHGSGANRAELVNQLSTIVSARHPSQLYQAFFEGVVLTVIVCIAMSRRAAPGVVGAWFLIGYGVLRVIAEFFRLPDAHLSVQRPLGLSRGQWFSAVMAIAGVLMLLWARKQAKLVWGAGGKA